MGIIEQYATGNKLNIGCGTDCRDGWVNVDFHGAVGSDYQFDLRSRWSLFQNSTFDTVLASHVLEHFSGPDLFHVMFEAGRVLRPGGRLLGIVPYATSEIFYANPFHKQAWTERTPMQFDRRLYHSGGGPSSLHADQGMKLQPWDVECVYLRPAEGWEDEPDIQAAARKYLNVIDEMHFVMKLVEE